MGSKNFKKRKKFFAFLGLFGVIILLIFGIVFSSNKSPVQASSDEPAIILKNVDTTTENRETKLLLSSVVDAEVHDSCVFCLTVVIFGVILTELVKKIIKKIVLIKK
jgi:hypothetical protein